MRDFKQAWEAKDIDARIGLLDPTATATGGLVTAAPRPIHGGDVVARYFVDLADRAATEAPNMIILERRVNGESGLVVTLDGATVAVLAFDVPGDQVKRVWAVLNPEKLRPWTG